jgi:large subunit ribosomal protein L1
MAKISKRKKIIQDTVDTQKVYPLNDALTVLKKLSESVNFEESVDVSLQLGIDARKSDQGVRSAVVLPHGTGKSVRVAVFAQGDNEVKAKEAGADVVGFEELADSIKKGEINFDVLIATPDAMRLVGQLGQILGPKGLMPNPKEGTVTTDVTTAVGQVKAGRVKIRNDKNGIIHCSVGKVGFGAEKIEGNLKALISDLVRVKPANAKGVYIKKLVVSTTMGPGLAVELAGLMK